LKTGFKLLEVYPLLGQKSRVKIKPVLHFCLHNAIYTSHSLRRRGEEQERLPEESLESVLMSLVDGLLEILPAKARIHDCCYIIGR
jgi:hypothetical protein